MKDSAEKIRDQYAKHRKKRQDLNLNPKTLKPALGILEFTGLLALELLRPPDGKLTLHQTRAELPVALSLRIQITQCRQYLQTCGPYVGMICILGGLFGVLSGSVLAFFGA